MSVERMFSLSLEEPGRCCGRTTQTDMRRDKQADRRAGASSEGEEEGGIKVFQS